MDVEKWPTWLRWLLFLPATIIAPIVYLIIVNWGVPPSFQEGLVWEVLTNGIWGGIFVAVGAWISPARRITALILCAFLLVLLGFSLALIWVNPYGYSDPPLTLVVSNLSGMAGGAYVAWIFVRATPAELGESADT